MVDRRSVLKAGLAGVAGSALIGGAEASNDNNDDDWRFLVIENVGDEQQEVRVVVDGHVAFGPRAGRPSDSIQNVDGRGFIRSGIDAGAVDDFLIRGEIIQIEWTETKPRMTLDGERIDPEDFTGEDDEMVVPSRIQFVATSDDLNVFLRVSEEILNVDDDTDEVRVRLDEGEVETLHYAGNIRELRTANGEFDVYITQR